MNTFEIEYRRRLQELCKKFAGRRKTMAVVQLPSLEFILESVLEDGAHPDNKSEYAGFHERGKTCPALYRRLRNAYVDLLKREGPGAGLRLEPCDDSLACVRLVSEPNAVMELPTILDPGVGRTEDDGLEFHRQPYDLAARNLPKHILDMFNGNPRAGDNHALVDCVVDRGAVRLRSRIASYGQIVDTSDCLTAEACFVAGLMEDWMGRADVKDEEFFATLTWRRRLHEREGTIRDGLLRPKHRAAGIGLSVATIMRARREDKRQWTILRARRGGKVGVHTDIYHVAPAGMMQHYGEKVLMGYHATLTLLKESLEELFDVEEAQDVGSGDVVLTRDRFDAVFPPQHTRFDVLGVVIDLTNLRPEICVGATLTDQRASELLPAKVRGNWEGKVVPVDPWREGPLDLAPQQWVQSGAACWRMAVAKLAP